MEPKKGQNFGIKLNFYDFKIKQLKPLNWSFVVEIVTSLFFITNSDWKEGCELEPAYLQFFILPKTCISWRHQIVVF